MTIVGKSSSTSRSSVNSSVISTGVQRNGEIFEYVNQKAKRFNLVAALRLDKVEMTSVGAVIATMMQWAYITPSPLLSSTRNNGYDQHVANLPLFKWHSPYITKANQKWPAFYRLFRFSLKSFHHFICFMKKLWPSNQSFNQTKYKCTFLYEHHKYTV